MKLNTRISTIEDYHFKKIDEIKLNMLKEKVEILDLGIGDPDLPVDKIILNTLISSLKSDNFNKYPPYDGIHELKDAIIKYYKDIYNVILNNDEVIILIGSKEGISHLIPAVCGIGDCAIITNPSYPVYETCCCLWGVQPYKIPLRKEKNYLPEIKIIPQNIINECKLLIINYPNNPTGAVANDEFYTEIIKFCNENNIVLCNDGAYNQIIMEGQKPLSLLQFDAEKKSIEFGTFSKLYNMTGFRIGYAVGNSEIIKLLLKVKSNMDSGQFIPIQKAAAKALSLNGDYVNKIIETYTCRRKITEEILTNNNINYYKGNGTFYLWGEVPKNYADDEFCEELLRKYKILVTPGYIFGSLGYNHFRISLTKDVESIKNAFNKMEPYLF